MAVTDYLRVDQLKVALRIAQDNFDDQLAMAIAAASRQIDEYTNDRFYRDDSPTPRLFTPRQARRLALPSFATTDGLVVEVDLDDDGEFETTWTLGVEFQVAPTAPQTGWPFTEIQTLGSAWLPGQCFWGWAGNAFPYYNQVAYSQWWPLWRSQRARVRVTAVWGWPAVPSQVTQACQILAVDYWKSKDLTGGAAGTTVMSTSVFGGTSGTQYEVAGFNPLARALLCGLREPVVA